MPPGVSRDINMLLQAKTLSQTQELHCKMTGEVVDITTMTMLVDMEQSEVRRLCISGTEDEFGLGEK